MSESVLPMFSSKSFIVSDITFRSLIHKNGMFSLCLHGEIGVNKVFFLLIYAECKHHRDKYNQFSSVAQWCPTLCDPMNRSTPGLPVYHHLPEFTQTHIHQVRDAIQPSHPQSSPSPAPNPCQHQSLFQ